MNLRLNANAIITNKQGKILFIKLKKGPLAGGLCIPGGGVNPGESGEGAIRRELKEEAKINNIYEIKPVGFCELINNNKGHHRIVLLFHGNSEDIPKETEEGFSLWEKFEDIKDELIPFARKSIEMWQNQEHYFDIIE